jgi:hypothetical protein
VPATHDSTNTAALGKTLVAIHDWTFLLVPGLIVGVGNGLLLGSWCTGPAWCRGAWPCRGLIGGPLICASGILVLFDVIDAGSPVQAIATNPGIHLGVVARHLPHVQGVQAVSDPLPGWDPGPAAIVSPRRSADPVSE